MNVWVMTKYGEKESLIKFSTLGTKMTRGVGGVPCPLWLSVENGDILASFPVSTGLNAVACNGSNVLHTSRVDYITIHYQKISST